MGKSRMTSNLEWLKSHTEENNFVQWKSSGWKMGIHRCLLDLDKVTLYEFYIVYRISALLRRISTHRK